MRYIVFILYVIAAGCLSASASAISRLPDAVMLKASLAHAGLRTTEALIDSLETRLANQDDRSFPAQRVLFEHLAAISPREALLKLGEWQRASASTLSALQGVVLQLWGRQPPSVLWSDLGVYATQKPLGLPFALQIALRRTFEEASPVAVRVLPKPPPGLYRIVLLHVVATYPWSERQRSSLGPWLGSFASDLDSASAMADYAERLGFINPVEGYSWAYHLPPGPSRHYALVQFFRMLGSTYPRVGLRWFNEAVSRHHLDGPGVVSTTVAWPEDILARDIVAAYIKGLLEKQPPEGASYYFRGVTDPIYGPLFREEFLRALRGSHLRLAWTLYQANAANTGVAPTGR